MEVCETYKNLKSVTNIAVQNEKKAYIIWKLIRSNESEIWKFIKNFQIRPKINKDINQHIFNYDNVNFLKNNI